MGNGIDGDRAILLLVKADRRYCLRLAPTILRATILRGGRATKEKKNNGAEAQASDHERQLATDVPAQDSGSQDEFPNKTVLP